MQQMKRPRSFKTVLAIVVTGGLGVGLAVAGISAAATTSAAPTVNCPAVTGKLAAIAIPTQAVDEVNRNLALLNTQIQEANKRLVTSQGEGGPNFIQNAILGPLKDKRVATINRIATAIGRNAAKPQGLAEALATCTLDASGKTNSAVEGTVKATAVTQAAVGTVNCPTVADRLPAIPAQAQAEVQRNLDLLNTQIAEANARLISTAGQGGPNFIQNAILGPLKDKRVATINRIATAIGRNAAKPQGLAEALATCTLNAGSAAGGGAASGGASAAPTTPAGNAGSGSTAVGTISCPTVADKLPAVPAQAQAEVQRNLDLLNTQIAEANNRLVSSVGQGGPNFVQNAILGPLADKRASTIDRIAIAIGRVAAKPTNLGGLATCSVA
jgi:phage-related protein